MTGPDPAPPTIVYRAYVGLAALVAPFAMRRITAKMRAQNVPVPRIHERLGHATQPRPGGRLIWFHAASVGESLSVLSLITRLGEMHPDLRFLITSGTATSAELIAKRMPPRCQHQFAPIDAVGPAKRFLRHWQPDGAVFVESELWPQLLVHTAKRGIPMVLLNARLSAKSVRQWQKMPRTARFVLDVFTLLQAQNLQSAENLIAMGADPARVKVGENIKSVASPLPVDQAVLTGMRKALGARPVWVASSTHPGEERIVLAAHKALLRDHPTLCLILVPRHPERGAAVAQEAVRAGLSMAQRSLRQSIGADTQVYVADTLGETGTWYALSGIVFMAGSLLPIGGHNPFEPAAANTAILSGPHVANFAETYQGLTDRRAVRIVETASDIADDVGRLLTDPDYSGSRSHAALDYVRDQQAGLDRVAQTVSRALKLP